MGRNKLVWGIMLVIALCGLFWAYAFANADGEVRFVRQMVGRDGASRTIIWQSDALDEKAKVAYRRSGDGVMSEVRPKVERCVVDGDMFFRYQAEIDGLVRGVEYDYRVGSENSSWHRFRVADDAYTALVFADSQCGGDYRVWQEVARVAREAMPSAELCLHLGDMVDCGASWYQWERWLTGAEGVLLSCALPASLPASWHFQPPHHQSHRCLHNDPSEESMHVPLPLVQDLRLP